MLALTRICSRFLPLLAVAAILLAPAALSACPCGDNCQCGPDCRCGGAPPPPQVAPASSELRVRKNQTDLTDQERQDFIDALFALKTNFRPGATLSIYDEFVRDHAQSFSSGQAHGGAAFLPWHRQYLLEFENELRKFNPNVTIPYWDFTDPKGTAALFSPSFLGGNGNPNNDFIVEDGPFRGPSAMGTWALAFDGPDLRRQFAANVETLPTAAQVAAAFGVGRYDAPPFDNNSPIDQSFRNHLEGFFHPSGEPELHNRVHAWIGGSANIIFSPNDPMFWLLHANIDRLWAEWQEIYGLDYVPVEGGREGHNLNDRMSPFGVTPAQVLDHRALGYRYDTQTAGVIPEPGSVVLAVLGGLGLLGWRVRRRAEPATRGRERPVPS